MYKSPKDYCMNCDGKNKLAFIHIPRSAGKSIRREFQLGWHDKNYRRTSTYSCAHRRASIVWPQEVIDNFITFSVIRDPWSRLVSLYHYYAGREDMERTYNYFKRYKDFSDFVLDLNNVCIAGSRNVDENVDELPDNFNSCAYFICDNNNKILVKNLIRFENLNDDLKLFAEKNNISIKLPLPRVKKKTGLKHKYYKEYYTNDKLIQKVADKYRRDLEIFGFEYK